MNVHFTLLLASRNAILLQHFGDTLERAWIMPYEGTVLHDTLSRALLSRPAAPLAILLDTETLDVRADEVPPVAFWERQRLIERQCGFHFPKAPMAGSSRLAGKETLVLHAASSAEENIHKNLVGLYSIGNPIDEMGFFPLECLDLIKDLADAPSAPLMHVLLLGEATGLRQMVLKDGLPVFTRLHKDCAPSGPHDQLPRAIAAHIQSTRDFLPRLGLTHDAMALQLFVPETLKDLSQAPELQALGCKIIALEAPRPDLVPPLWGLDIALLAGLGAPRRKRLVPFTPDWLKTRTRSWVIREDVSIAMFVFGCAGISIGLLTLLNPPQAEPAPVAMVQPAAPPAVTMPEASPPELKLDAMIYNGPQDWSVWINGQKYTPVKTEGPINVLDVTPSGVRVQWEQGASSKEYLLVPENAASDAVK